MNVVVEIGREIGGQVVGHAFEILEGFKEGRYLFLHRFNAYNRARWPRYIARNLDYPLFNDGGNAHGHKCNPPTCFRRGRKIRPMRLALPWRAFYPYLMR